MFGEKEYEVDGNTGFYTTIRYTGEVKGIENVPVPKQQLQLKLAEVPSEWHGITQLAFRG